MTRTNLIRWAGLACVLSGILYAMAAAIHPSGEDVLSIVSALWVPAHILGGISAVLLLFGLLGLYGRQLEASGSLMLVGFVLAFIGTTLLATEEFQSATVMPLIAAKAPTLLEGTSTAGAALAFGLLFLVSFFLGYLLFGIATVRARVLPRWSGLLLILGLLLSLGGSISHLVSIIAAIILGLGLAWMGYAVWSGMASHS